MPLILMHNSESLLPNELLKIKPISIANSFDNEFYGGQPAELQVSRCR